MHRPCAFVVQLQFNSKTFPCDRLPELLLKVVLGHVHALDFPHTEARLIHADIQEKNILLNSMATLLWKSSRKRSKLVRARKDRR